MGVEIRPFCASEERTLWHLSTSFSRSTLQTIFKVMRWASVGGPMGESFPSTLWIEELAAKFSELQRELHTEWPEGWESWSWEECEEWEAQHRRELTGEELTFLRWAPQLIAQAVAGEMEGATRIHWS